MVAVVIIVIYRPPVQHPLWSVSQTRVSLVPHDIYPTFLISIPLISTRIGLVVCLKMGVEPPFLYDPPSQYSFTGPTDKGFNPRAATQASRVPQRHAPRQEGPLINNINRHPDSYLIVPYGNVNVKPMSPRTKSKVKYARSIQLFLRICALLGAVGMLVCVICIKGTQDTVGWIIRIPVSMTHGLY